MFEGRRRGALRRAIKGADSTVEELKDKIAARMEKIARLELEAFDIQAVLEAFRAEYERRVGPYIARVTDLEREIESARREADYRAIWQGRSDAPEFESTVSEQFRKAWSPGGRRRKPKKSVRLPPPVDMEELRKLYRSLAKRFHPDLTLDPEEKLKRQELMAVINQAYMEQDQQKLSDLAEKPDVLVPKPQPMREHQVLDLYQEMDRLDALILKLENQINELNTSDDLQMALEYKLARYEDRDLLAEYVRTYKDRIRVLEEELASLRT